MKNLIRHILLEESQKWEYQIRDIGGPVYYKRQKGSDWSFIDEAEFYKNSNRNNLVKWVEKKPPKPPYVRQVDVPNEMKIRIDYLKVYYENLSPNDFKIEIEGEDIIKIKTKMRHDISILIKDTKENINRELENLKKKYEKIKIDDSTYKS